MQVTPAIINLARQLERELSCAQENFHVTNQAYVKADARIAELTKENTTMEQDAKRYRWLRQSDCRDGAPFIAIFDGRLTQWTGKFADEQVDSAIDAALKR
jgi:hypothetical protein